MNRHGKKEWGETRNSAGRMSRLNLPSSALSYHHQSFVKLLKIQYLECARYSVPSLFGCKFTFFAATFSYFFDRALGALAGHHRAVGMIKCSASHTKALQNRLFLLYPEFFVKSLTRRLDSVHLDSKANDCHADEI